jgi:hypothetical protein
MRGVRRAGWLASIGAAVVLANADAWAAAIDENGEITLGVRTYTAARIGSENTDISIICGNDPKQICGQDPGQPRQTYRSLTFPVSAAGHLRQNRFYIEAELRQKLDRLIREGFGPFVLLNDLPFKLRNVGYNLVYRGEYEGIYDYGPAEYRTAFQYFNERLVPPFQNQEPDVGGIRRELRHVAVERQRLFQAFVEADVGNLFLRFGRQILAWGETDAFRLLDNINPLDNSFGGFLIPLDERRVPLDMLRASYSLSSLPGVPFNELFLEGYVAVDNAVSIDPGIPVGSPWQLPNFAPTATVLALAEIPPRNFKSTRGGAQLKFNTPLPLVGEGTFGIAHYYTYLDVPAVQSFVQGDPNTGLFFPLAIQQGPATNFLALAIQSLEHTQITGASSTFALPADLVRTIGLSGEPVFRTELAYFHNEPRFTQATLDPFVYGISNCGGGALTENGLCTGNVTCAQFAIDPSTGKRKCVRRVNAGPRRGDSWNLVIGIDLNQFIRPLNPRQSFFITTQFFYKHLKNPAKRQPIPPVGRFNYLPGQPKTFDGEVLPVPAYTISPDNRGTMTQASEAVFIHNPVDQFLQTFVIATSYYSGQVVPALGIFYDWSGAVVAQPTLTLSYDPFRFTMSYSYLYASTLKGASGISLLRDRDNVLFQLEYVI